MAIWSGGAGGKNLDNIRERVEGENLGNKGKDMTERKPASKERGPPNGN